MKLADSVGSLRFVGPIYARRLTNLGIVTIKDLLFYFPFRYEDLTSVATIAEATPGEVVTITAALWQIRNIRTKNRKFLTTAVLNDGSASIEAVWFNQPYLTRSLKTGMRLSVSGKIGEFNRRPTLVSPDYEILKETGETIHTGRLVPIYSETFGISSKWLRSRIKPLLGSLSDQVEETLPAEILATHQLLGIREALWQIHFPDDATSLQAARHRFGFEELLLIQLRARHRKNQWQAVKTTHPFKIEANQVERFISQLPFSLTEAQRRVSDEIRADLKEDRAMNRLLEGDVGSGKTVVAALAIYLSFLNGFAAVVMAPTEILATQHYDTLTRLLTPLGLKVVLQTGSKKGLKKDGQFDCLVGTHALLTESVDLAQVGLVVIDEQHRFGVAQRARLRAKGDSPHVLTMTATPIPRTIALTLFGDLDLSVIDQLPEGRRTIKTYVVPPEKRSSAYGFIRDHLHLGEQAFIIAPFIDPSETMGTVKAATTEYDRLSHEVFPDFKVGLLHGRLKAKEKDQILADFREKRLHILVATPVVEVGIDIPNATLMMVEGADRFGLAQLHQLRGRVGRSSRQSFCLLFTDNPAPVIVDRLRILEKYHQGVQVAEADLKTRGPGEIYGTMQHGIPDLKVASFNDLELMEKTQILVSQLLSRDPSLAQYPLLKKQLDQGEQEVAPD